MVCFVSLVPGTLLQAFIFIGGNNAKVVNGNGVIIGDFDGEFVINNGGSPIYRTDNDEVYSLDVPCKSLGESEGKTVIDLSGLVLFSIVN